MPRNRRPTGIGRAIARRRAVQPGRTRPTPQPITFDRLLAVQIVDHMLDWLLHRPRALLIVIVIVGLLLITRDLYPLLRLSPAARAPVVAPVSVVDSAPTAPSHPDVSVEQEALAVVASYNQASITAAVLGKVDPMLRYLAPEGSAWSAVQAEYRRRATKGESHDPALTRWGVLRVAVDGDTATVETQEQWDDITSVGGEVVSSRRGILTRNTYELRRSLGTARWLITTVSSGLISR